MRQRRSCAPHVIALEYLFGAVPGLTHGGKDRVRGVHGGVDTFRRAEDTPVGTENTLDLHELQRHWDTFGKTDPLWAILTHASKRGNRWDVDEFFATGRQEIGDVIARVHSLPFHFQPAPLDAKPEDRRGVALDFGCGVGRLTQAMCLSFRECHGVDIAPSMIDLAEQTNVFPDRCHYHLNDRPDLDLFGHDTFDFIYTNLVLQHMEPRFAKRYIGEFIRVLKPGGVLVFQVPSHYAAPALKRTRIEDRLNKEACSAEITCECKSCTVATGGILELRVNVHNLSRYVWPALGPEPNRFEIHLANHWLDSAGRTLQWDDARVNLPEDIAPGKSTELRFSTEVRMPPGDFLLELDMVQEQVAWFAESGSKTLRIPVHVTSSQAHEGPAGAEDFSPAMEMYAIPKQEVLDIVAAHGAAAVAVDSSWSSPDWEGYRYFVTRL